jgi:para-nitrobenzyl esterase
VNVNTLVKGFPSMEVGANKEVSFKPIGGSPVAPIVDGYVILDEPNALFAAGKESPVPLVIGHTRDEMSLFLSSTPMPKTAAEFQHRVSDSFGAAGSEIATLFPSQDAKEIKNGCIALSTDVAWGLPTRTIARLHAHNGYPTYRYVFSRGTKQFPLTLLGAHHGCELAYVFGFSPEAKPDDAEKKTVDVVQHYWLNFAANGDPNGNGLPKWPKFTSGTDPLVEFNDGVDVREHYRQKEYDTLEKVSTSSKPTTRAVPAGAANRNGAR